MVRGFKECCVSDETNGREDEEEAVNVGSKHKSVSGECGTQDVNCLKALKLGRVTGMVNRVRLAKVNED
jgi:hypothetical protein